MTVNEFLKQDRQWTRALRIAHATYQLNKATEEPDKDFWTKVLEVNGQKTGE